MPSTGGNTCVANFVHTTIFPNGPKDFEDKDDGRVIGNLVGLNLFDDYGLWCSYGQLHRDFIYCYSKGVFKRVLPAEEYAEIRWNLNWKRVTLISLKIFTTVWRIVWVS